MAHRRVGRTDSPASERMPGPTRLDRLDRLAGCLAGLAIGDALGTPTQPTAAATHARYGYIQGFLTPDADDPFGHAGLAAGQITDDTQAALALVTGVIRRRAFSVEIAAEALVAWLDSIHAATSPYVGPSTKAAYQALQRGVPPAESGRGGATNGAAMRVAPLGFLHADFSRVVRAAADSALPTHNSPLGLASAAAVAGAVHAAARGAPLAAVIGSASRGADEALTLYAGPALFATVPNLGRRIQWAVKLMDGELAGPDPEGWTGAVWFKLRDLYDYVGAGMAAHESVPAAFAVLALAGGDAWTAGLLAANLGGDGDTIGAMAGAMGGALSGLDALPADAVRQVEQVNGLNFRQLARDFLDAAGDLSP